LIVLLRRPSSTLLPYTTVYRSAINELEGLLEVGFSGCELKVLVQMIQDLDKLDEHADDLESTMRSALFGLEDNMPAVDVMFPYKVIDWIGDISNHAHDVGGRLQLLLAR